MDHKTSVARENALREARIPSEWFDQVRFGRVALDDDLAAIFGLGDGEPSLRFFVRDFSAGVPVPTYDGPPGDSAAMEAWLLECLEGRHEALAGKEEEEEEEDDDDDDFWDDVDEEEAELWKPSTLADEDHVEHLRDVLMGMPDVEAVGELLREFPELLRAEIDRDGPGGGTALHFAARQQHMDGDVVRALVFAGIDVEARDASGETPLHIAAASGAVGALRGLLELDAAVDALDEMGEPPLYKALMGWAQFQTRGFGQPPVKYNLAAKILVDAGADVTAGPADDLSCFQLAARTHNLPMLEQMVQLGADVNAARSDGLRPIHFVLDVSEHQQTLSKFLLTRWSPTMRVPRELHDSWNAWRIKFKSSVLIDGVEQTYNRTVFDDTMSRWTMRFLRVLANSTAHELDVDAADRFGTTALHFAAFHGDNRAVEWLLERGAAIDRRTLSDNYSPVQYAALRDYQATVDLLLARGAAAADVAEIAPHMNGYAADGGDERPRHRAPEPAQPHPFYDASRVETGGWHADVASELDISHCDIDRRSNLSKAEFVEQYLKPGRPVIITDALEDHASLREWTREGFVRKFGKTPFSVMENVDGRPRTSQMTLAEYVRWLDEHAGEPMPSYVFDGYYEDAAPAILRDSGRKPSSSRTNLRYREPYFDDFNYFTYQLVLGPAYAGANPHFHHTTWNGLVFGRKRWMVWPPARSFYSAKHPHRWFTEDYETVKALNPPLECIQERGDLFFIPDQWGHMVINLNDALAVAETGFFGRDSLTGLPASMPAL